MEKIVFQLPDSQETVDFFVLEQTRINGADYILVTDAEDGEHEAVYEIVEDDDELEALSVIFGEMLEDVDLTF